MAPTPQWEHGYRCHGYWIGVKRVGWVGLSPYLGGLGSVAADGYSWGVVHPKTGAYLQGRYRTLRAAKARVEREYRRLYTPTEDVR